jgi:hypothetical protein
VSTIRAIATVKAEARFGEEGLTLLRLTGLSSEMPSWFQRIEHEFKGTEHDWMDHPSSDGDTLIYEPYDLSHKALVDLLDFADRFGLSVSISALSAHYPTRTVAIFLTPREEARAA